MRPVLLSQLPLQDSLSLPAPWSPASPAFGVLCLLWTALCVGLYCSADPQCGAVMRKARGVGGTSANLLVKMRQPRSTLNRRLSTGCLVSCRVCAHARACARARDNTLPRPPCPTPTQTAQTRPRTASQDLVQVNAEGLDHLFEIVDLPLLKHETRPMRSTTVVTSEHGGADFQRPAPPRPRPPPPPAAPRRPPPPFPTSDGVVSTLQTSRSWE